MNWRRKKGGGQAIGSDSGEDNSHPGTVVVKNSAVQGVVGLAIMSLLVQGPSQGTSLHLLEYSVDRVVPQPSETVAAEADHDPLDSEVRIHYAVQEDMLLSVVAPNLPKLPPSEDVFRETLFDFGDHTLLRRGAWLLRRTPLDIDCREFSPRRSLEWRLKIAS